jgi:hypothetical protein
LWGIPAANPFAAGDLVTPSQGPGSSTPRIEGGLIAFGGGVPLYRNGKIVGAHVDDITYPSADGRGVFSHPLCQNTVPRRKIPGERSAADLRLGNAATQTAQAKQQIETKKSK